MAFKTLQPKSLAPDSPEKLFLELPRRRIPDVLPHQQETMRAYASEAVDLPDVALQLPTGSGKTLVGLLIAEWRRRKNGERVVYLCPTRQLVNQVVEQAEEKYGLTVQAFTGSAATYETSTKAAYRSGDRIAVTTYSSLFNTNPFFHDADVLIVDDAHAAENYVASLWSVGIDRTDSAHAQLHTALRGVIKPHIDAIDFARLGGEWQMSSDSTWVDKLPTSKFRQISEEVEHVVSAHVEGTSLAYPWSMIRGHLHACHVYLSASEIVIRPLVSPTWSHAAFHDPRQRIYMSATLGAGGDLERLMGRRRITRLPIPSGWDRQGVGRRFFIFPGISLDAKGQVEVRRLLMSRASRSLVLVPSEKMRSDIARDVEDELHFKVFDAGDIEESKRPFVSSNRAVAVVANRYDGIDFPGDECRLLFVEGLPKATNLQERFLMARMSANVLLNERVQVRVLQAIGRCTRSLEDYSAVVVGGEQLTDYLVDGRRRIYLHPEVQAELSFGIDQSKETTAEDFVENLDIFLENGERWEQVNQTIVANRAVMSQESFPAIAELRSVVEDEVKFHERLWQGDYEAALECAGRVLAGLNVAELRGYRALWHYLAGSAAEMAVGVGISELDAKARQHYSQAKNAASGIRWLVALGRKESAAKTTDSDGQDLALAEQVERLERELERLGTAHDRRFAMREKEILEGLESKERGPFERAHRLLGQLVGFDAGNQETDGAPDPWWISGHVCLVFEDHAGASTDSALDVSKARQVASHPAWMRGNGLVGPDADVQAVLITPVTRVKEGAIVHLEDVALWRLQDFRRWATEALSVVREARRTFVEPGDLVWRGTTAELFEQRGLNAQGLLAKLQASPVVDGLEVVR